MNVPAATDLLLNKCDEFDELHIHGRRFIRMVTPQKIIEVVERRLIVCSALCPKRNGQAFFGLQIEQADASCRESRRSRFCRKSQVGNE